MKTENSRMKRLFKRCVDTLAVRIALTVLVCASLRAAVTSNFLKSKVVDSEGPTPIVLGDGQPVTWNGIAADATFAQPSQMPGVDGAVAPSTLIASDVIPDSGTVGSPTSPPPSESSVGGAAAAFRQYPRVIRIRTDVGGVPGQTLLGEVAIGQVKVAQVQPDLVTDPVPTAPTGAPTAAPAAATANSAPLTDAAAQPSQTTFSVPPPVPEASSAALFTAGLGLVGLLRRRARSPQV